MHELSIVTYVIKQVEAIAKENGLTKVSSVTLEFGEVSGIVTGYLVDCWDWYAKKEALIEGARLICETIPAVTWCDDCKKLTRPSSTERPARIAAAAIPGCSREPR